MASRKTVYCSFCGKAGHEVFCIVEGPAAGICDECAPLVADVIQDQRGRVARGETCSPCAGYALGIEAAMTRTEAERRVIAAARALKFGTYPARGRGFVVILYEGDTTELQEALTELDALPSPPGEGGRG